MLMIDAALTDDELAELALAADPHEHLEPDAVPLAGTGDDFALLPRWYMPAPIATAREIAVVYRGRDFPHQRVRHHHCVRLLHHLRPPRGRVVATAPLAHGSISLRIYPHDLEPPAVVAEIVAQCVLAEQAGFDGVMTQEHHGGFPNYLPSPLLTATWALEADQHLVGRAVSDLVAVAAVDAARRRSRLDIAPLSGTRGMRRRRGCVPARFRDGRRAVRRDASPVRGRAARGRGGARRARDRPIGQRSRRRRVGGLAHPARRRGTGALGHAARRAARARGHLQLAPDQERTRALSDIHADEGGTAPRILIRRVWLGPPPLDALNAQMARFRAVGPADLQAHWDPDGGLVSAEDGAELAERLHDAMVGGRCDAINLRVFQAGLSPSDVRDQIALLGEKTLPHLRALLN